MIARDIHAKSETAREAQKYTEALSLADQAILAYSKEKDLRGLAEILSSKSITYRTLAAKDASLTPLLIIAEHEILAAIDIAQGLSDPSALVFPYRNLGSVYLDLGKYQEAADYLKKSLDSYQQKAPPENDRPGVLAEIKIRLAEAQYLSGDKSAYQRLLTAIEEMKNSGEEKISKYNFDVWLSGAHLKAARILKVDDREKAKEHLEKARDIANSNPELATRREQIDKLTSSLAS